jgi:pimeloyl-ACP methyl ester carboxylesterase
VKSQVRDNNIEIAKLNISYQIAGDIKKPHLIFLHGWGARKDNIFGKGKEQVVRQLAKYFYVVAPELPGFIRSDSPKKTWNLKDYAKFVNKFIKSIDLNYPIIMGQSFGGGIATEYAKKYPKSIPILILIDSTYANRSKNWYYMVRFKLKPIRDFMIGKSYVPIWMKKLVICSYLGVPFSHLSKNNVKDYLIMTDIQTSYEVKVDYKKLKMPTLIIWGSKDTLITPLDRAREILNEIPNSKMIIIDDGGHLALYTHTGKVIKEIIKFVKNNRKKVINKRREKMKTKKSVDFRPSFLKRTKK